MTTKRELSNIGQTDPAAWAGSLMLRDPRRWSARLGLLAARLQLLTRGQRRRFGRAAVGALAGVSGIALMALLAGPMAVPVAASGLTVGAGGCNTLVDAIKAANTGATVNGCDGTGGADTITLAASPSYDSAYAANTALPDITTDITIQADSGTRTITLNSSGFRAFNVTGPNGVLKLQNINISGGSLSAVDGAQIYAGAGTSLTIDGGAFSGGYTSADGGSIYAKGDLFVMGNATVSSNTSNGNGGGVHVQGVANVSIVDSTIYGNKTLGNFGGGLFVTDTTTLVISNTEISTNRNESSSNFGGGAWIEGVDSLSMQNSTVYKNFADERGAGIIVKNTSGVISNTAFTENKTYGPTSALGIWDSTIEVVNSTFVENTATGNPRGGAGAEVDNSTATFDNVTFQENWAVFPGGGMSVMNSSNVTITHSTVITNRTFVYGAGIYTSSSTLTISDSTISGNDGFRGGGLYSSNSTVAVTNTIINNNVAYANSGGVRITYGSVAISDSTIANNKTQAHGKGGGLFVRNASMTMTDTVVSGNYANDKGGGIYMIGSSSQVTIKDGVVSDNIVNDYKGGGVYINDGTITFNGTSIISNTAEQEGGGFYVMNGTVTINEATIISNTAKSGGGLALYGGVTTVTGSTIDSNSTVLGGGGGVAVANGTAVITGTNIVNNYSFNDGGGISAGTNANLTVSQSLIDGNETPNEGGGIAFNGTSGAIDSVTVSNNSSTGKGGGLFLYSGDVSVVNSTIISNTSRNNDGGGIVLSGADVTIKHMTLTANYAKSEGGGIYSSGGSAHIYRSIISGNSHGTNDDNEMDEDLGDILVYDSVLGHAGLTYDQSFSGSPVLDPSNIIATSDRANIALSAILDAVLADNGGEGTLPGGENTKTKNLPEGSPAIDIAARADCDIDVDQRGVSRPRGSGCDAGAVEVGSESAATFVSIVAPGTVGEIEYGPQDILKWDGSEWTKWFDGAAAGLGTPKKFKHNINAMWISDTESVDVVMSFAQNDRFLPGIDGKVDGMDLVRWDGSGFSVWFDGQDVGLTIKAQEKIDGLHVLSEAPKSSQLVGEGCEAYLLISTHGPGIVPAAGFGRTRAVLKFGGEDVLGFCATSLGENTAGSWEIVLDGSAEGVSRNNIDSISMSDDGTTMYLTSRKAFNVDSAAGNHSMVYAFDMIAGTFSGPLFSVTEAGMRVGTKVDGLHLASK